MEQLGPDAVMVSRLTMAGVATVGAAVALLAVPGTASAAGWDGTDPAGTICASDAYTARSAYAHDPNGHVQALIELRYSPRCRTTWGRITTVNMPNCRSGASTPYCGAAGIRRTSDGRQYACSIPVGDHGCHTKQVNDAGVSSFAFGNATDGTFGSYAQTSSW